MSSEGTLNQAKKRLLALIQIAIPEAGLISGDWREAQQNIYSIKTGKKLPIITVRVNPARIVPSFYGRIWEGETAKTGDIGMYAFTAHCFHSNCLAGGEEKYAHAHNLAERVMHYLNTQDYNAGIHTSECIGDVMDLVARESEPKGGSRTVSRVIVEGTLLVKRVD